MGPDPERSYARVLTHKRRRRRWEREEKVPLEESGCEGGAGSIPPEIVEVGDGLVAEGVRNKVLRLDVG